MKRALELLLNIAVVQSVTVTLAVAAIGPEYYYYAHHRQVNDGPLRGFDHNGLKLVQTPDRVHGVWRADRHRLQQAVVDGFLQQSPQTAASSSGWTPIIGGRPDVTSPPRSASGHTIDASPHDERLVDSISKRRYRNSSQHAKIADTENDRPARLNENNRQKTQGYFIFNDGRAYENAAANNGRAEANANSAPPQFKNADDKTVGDFAQVRNGSGDTASDNDNSGADFGYHADDDGMRADGKSDLQQIGTDHGGNHRMIPADDRVRKPNDVVRGRPDEASVTLQNRLVATSMEKTTERRPPLIAAVANATNVRGESFAAASRQRRRRVQSSTRRPTGEDANVDDNHNGFGKRENHSGHAHQRFTTSGDKSNARQQEPRPVTDRDDDSTAVVEQKPRGGYGFGYTVTNEHAGTHFGQWERREPGRSGTVTTGQYRVRLPDGRTQTVAYTADPDTGYKASVTYEGVQQYPRTRPSAVERHHDSTAAETNI